MRVFRFHRAKRKREKCWSRWKRSETDRRLMGMERDGGWRVKGEGRWRERGRKREEKEASLFRNVPVGIDSDSGFSDAINGCKIICQPLFCAALLPFTWCQPLRRVWEKSRGCCNDFDPSGSEYRLRDVNGSQINAATRILFRSILPTRFSRCGVISRFFGRFRYRGGRSENR